MSVVMSSISRSTVDCNVQSFDRKGLRQVQNMAGTNNVTGGIHFFAVSSMCCVVLSL